MKRMVLGLPPYGFGQTESGEFAMMVMILLYVTVVAVVAVVHRCDKAWIPAAVLALLSGFDWATAYHIGRLDVMVVFSLGTLSAGMISYAILRSRHVACGQWLSSAGAVLTAYLSASMTLSRATEFPRVALFYGLPLASLAISLILLIVVMVVRRLWRLGAAAGRPATDHPPRRDEEIAAVINMLKEEKISAGDAAQLLKALERDESAADVRPVEKPMVVNLIASLLIVVGFVLPWAKWRIPREVMPNAQQGIWSGFSHGGVPGFYQSGPDYGWTGWIILCLGVLPAILACIPDLDRRLRQGMLRMVLSSVGGALVGALALPIILAGRLPHIGMWLVLAGFTIQIASAARQSGLFAERSVGAELPHGSDG